MGAEYSSASRGLSKPDAVRTTSGEIADSKRAGRRLTRIRVLGCLFALMIALVGLELRTSWLESRLLAAIDRRISFSRAPGASDTIQYSGAGPYDQRLGYLRMPALLSHLEAAGFRIESQARQSKLYLFLAKLHIYPIYQEKAQAGLELLDRDIHPFYTSRYPSLAYSSFSEIPPVIVRTVLFVENRELLDPRHPYQNPAIGWSRLSRAVANLGLHAIDPKQRVIGGSTLATQLEKIRHSPGGKTHSVGEKFRQITTASLRAYRGGPETILEQQRIVLDYLNSIPLAATPDDGEINGLGDGLWAWYRANFSSTNFLLDAQEDALDADHQRQQARAYREVLSLLLALRAPSRYLEHDPAGLDGLVERYLALLCGQGIISKRLFDLASAETPVRSATSKGTQKARFVDNKGPDTVRTALLPLLGIKDTYALDRLDLTVATTIDSGAEQQVKQFLVGLKTPELVEKAGLQQHQLMSEGDPRAVIYSFVLYERGTGANLLRVQTDNYDQPLSINQGTRLQLGSTAKLRTLINYLQIVEALHEQYQGLSPSKLSAVNIMPDDHISEWAINYLSTAHDNRLSAMLKAALDRTYSANPSEGFLTAGGVQSFGNFDPEENEWVSNVGEAFEKSVNLVFIRLMRDIERYYIYRVPGASPEILDDVDNPARNSYLARFADEEGRVFLSRFYEKYSGQGEDRALETAARGGHLGAQRLAVLYRSVRPEDNPEKFSVFMRAHLPAELHSRYDYSKLYAAYGPDKFNLADRGYLAKIHPLELWLLNYREHYPNATFSDVVAGSTKERQEVYSWLFRPHYKNEQDHRIRIVLQEDAFKEICRAWRQLGYPFDSLVPSYATAIGVSGDTPAALAELMGTVMNGGIRYPSVAVQKLWFARNTPLETVLQREPAPARRVLSSEIAAIVHQELIGVVERGTARRAHGGIRLRDGTLIPVGGKTGTGDNQFRIFGAGGRPIGSHAVNRTAAFTFMVGNRFFGTVLAFVPGKSAEDYEFTSSLAVQIFKDLEPNIEQIIKKDEQ